MKTDEKRRTMPVVLRTYEVCSIFLWSTAGEVLGVHTMYVRIYRIYYMLYTIWYTVLMSREKDGVVLPESPESKESFMNS